MSLHFCTVQLMLAASAVAIQFAAAKDSATSTLREVIANDGLFGVAMNHSMVDGRNARTRETVYRFELFNFATRTAGGSADFDYHRVGNALND